MNFERTFPVTLFLSLSLSLFGGCSTPPDEPQTPLRFVDATEAAGLSYVQSRLIPGGTCLTSDSTCEADYGAGGAAVGDVDGDGRPDVFVTRLGEHDLLFLNRGERFEDATAAYGLDEIAALSNGATLFDADRDGDLDLYVTVLGRPGALSPDDRYYFFDNVGGRFVERAEERGLEFRDGAGHGGTSVAVGDYDRDGWPDLHLTEWRVNDNVNMLARTHERLLRNRGDTAPGHFEDVTEAAGVFLGNDYCRDNDESCIAHSYASTFTDLDDDGWPDLAVASDFGTSRLFWNDGDGTFTEGTAAAQVGTDGNGMGSTFGDYDGDGDLDWFVTGIGDARCEGDSSCGWGTDGNRLYRNDGARRFTDVTDEVGVRDASWAWGAAFFDPDADGDLDLLVVSGFDQPRVPGDDAFSEGQMFLFRNSGAAAKMKDIADAAGLSSTGQGRGLCVFDADGDGDLDVFVVEQGRGARFFRNETPDAGAWLGVRLLGPGGRGAAYGARVLVTADVGGPTQLREVGTGAHFLCGAEPVAHFGLGDVTRIADLEIRWPNGMRTHIADVSPGQVLEVSSPE